MDTDTHAADASTASGIGVGPKMPPAAELRQTLLSAAKELSDHGLKLSAKWAGEQLVGLPDESPDEWEHGGANGPSLEGRMVFAKALMDVGEFERASQVFGDINLDTDTTAAVVDTPPRRAQLPHRARFIRWYSLYLAGERRRQKESQLTDALERRRLVNVHLPTLHAELSALDVKGSLDAFGLFIYGAVLKSMRVEGRAGMPAGASSRKPPHTPAASPPPRTSYSPSRPMQPSAFTTPKAAAAAAAASSLSSFAHDAAVLTSLRPTYDMRHGRGAFGTPGTGFKDPLADGNAGSGVTLGKDAGWCSTTAQDVLIRSLRLFPYNWSAWLDLATICLDTDTVPEELEADPPCPWMHQFFLQHLLVEQHRCKDALVVLEYLRVSFPNSSYVLSQTAVAQYHTRNFDQGHADFKELRKRDPLRMEGLDIFSNILYVKECKAELSFLAHTTIKCAPLRTETNCIIGNYYSLKGHHENAVTYFMKALKLDRRCLSAWTLMGHEFVELKNSGAAIESYRQAVDINPKDYRAWYGLGQAYEILQMHLYAIYYYRRATALRPYDARMWIAMGNCLDKLGRSAEAIMTFERAMANGDREGISLLRLAKLYADDGRKDAAAKCYETMLERSDGDSASAEEGMLFLCYYYKEKGEFAEASKMANGLLDYTGTSREEALAVLREIRSIMESWQQRSIMNSNPFTFDDATNASLDEGGGGAHYSPPTWHTPKEIAEGGYE